MTSSPLLALSFQSGDTSVNRLYLHPHTGLSSKGVVINPFPFVVCIVPELVYVQVKEAFAASTANDRATECLLNHFRRDSENIIASKLS